MIATIIWAIIIFSLIIFIHEFGHFITAKLFHVKVNEFAIGMGPQLWKKQKGETLYSVRVFPIGGFCQMEGEDEDNYDPDSFQVKPKWQRFIILFAGAFMNFVLGFLLLILLSSLFTPKENFYSMTLADVTQGYPAYEAGLRPGDEILRVNGNRIHIRQDYNFYNNDPSQIQLEVCRDGKTLTFSFAPKAIKISQDGQILDENATDAYQTQYVAGIVFSQKDKNIGTVLSHSFYESCFMGKVVVVSLAELISGKVSPKYLSGPIGIVSEIGTAASMGLKNVLWLAALITINLGLMNLLPLPALDGGRILFLLIEAVTRKPLNPKVEGYFHAIGFVLLIGLLLYATSNDILRLFSS